MLEISVSDLKRKLDAGEPVKLIDVRETQQVPMPELFTLMTRPQADPGDEIVVYCHTGIRSLEAAQFLVNQRFENARSLAGGIDARAVEIEPGMGRY